MRNKIVHGCGLERKYLKSIRFFSPLEEIGSLGFGGVAIQNSKTAIIKEDYQKENRSGSTTDRSKISTKEHVKAILSLGGASIVGLVGTAAYFVVKSSFSVVKYVFVSLGSITGLLKKNGSGN